MIIQPVMVVEDDDGVIEEVVCDPVALSAKQWQAFADGGFDQAIAHLVTQLST